MSPVAMPCESEGCQSATKEYEPGVAVELLKLHASDKHTQAVGGSSNEDSQVSTARD